MGKTLRDKVMDMTDKQFSKWMKTASVDDIKKVLIQGIHAGEEIPGVCTSSSH